MIPDYNTAINNIIAEAQYTNWSLHILFSIMKLTGARHSDINNISNFNITSAGLVLLTPQKRNSQRKFDNPVLTYYVELAQTSALYFSSQSSYMHAYRLAKKHINTAGDPYAKKDLVTYIFRYEYIRSLIESNKTPLEIKAELGHYRLESTFEYLIKF